MTRSSADPCFFILGYGRSGTTLFRRMLSAHPQLFVAPENDVFQRLPQSVGRGVATKEALASLVADFPAYYGRIYDLDRFVRDASQRLPLALPDLIAILQGVSLIGRDKPDAQWGHKAPSEWPFVETWRQWFPNARYLHLVRHPHDSTASMNEYQLQRYRTTPMVSIWQWRKAFRSIRRQGVALGPEKYQMLRYEDLVSDPVRTLDAVCRFLDVSVDDVPRMIDFTSDASAEHVDEGMHMARAQSALTQERVGRAEHDYSPTQAALLDYVTRDELRMLDYSPRAGHDLSPARAAAVGTACVGLDLAWAGLRASRRARGQL